MDKMNKEDKKLETGIAPKTINARAISPSYFITDFNPNKFTKGVFFGNNVIFGKTFDQNLDGKIRIYEDRVKGWFLDHAKNLIRDNHADVLKLGRV